MLEEQKLRLRSRLRRLRSSPSLREMLRETRVHPSNLISPIFIRHGERIVENVRSMPGVNRYSVDMAVGCVSELSRLGIDAVLLFGIPSHKDELGSEAYSNEGVVPTAIRAIKRKFPSLVVAADVCLCEYTTHGHCGVIAGSEVDNDRSLPLLARAAVQYAKAGADIVAPSAMMDGQVQAIRNALDEAGFEDRILMSYSAKYASSFYGPFRVAAESAPSFGDRLGYQMSNANSREAMREIERDIKEGADIVMVKPALPCLDVIAKARSRFDLPIAAYNVSGEYSMLKAASMNGWIDEKRAVDEVLTAIKRAGADLIISYHAEEFARWSGGS